METVLKGPGVRPVLDAEISLIAHGAGVDDDAEDNEAYAGGNLDETEDELDCGC